MKANKMNNFCLGCLFFFIVVQKLNSVSDQLQATKKG